MNKDEVRDFADQHHTGVLNIFAQAHDWAANQAKSRFQFKEDHNLFDDYSNYRTIGSVPWYVQKYIEVAT